MSKEILLIAWAAASVGVGLVLGRLLYRRRLELEQRSVELQERPPDAGTLRGARRREATGSAVDPHPEQERSGAGG